MGRNPCLRRTHRFNQLFHRVRPIREDLENLQAGRITQDLEESGCSLLEALIKDHCIHAVNIYGYPDVTDGESEMQSVPSALPLGTAVLSNDLELDV